MLDHHHPPIREVPRNGHLVARGGVNAGEDESLAVLGPAHICKRGAWGLGAGVWPRLSTDKEVLILGGAAGVAVYEEAERDVVVLDQVHHRRGLHLFQLLA